MLLFYGTVALTQLRESSPTGTEVTYYKKYGGFKPVSKKKGKFKKVKTHLGEGITKTEYIDMKSGKTRYERLNDLEGPIGVAKDFDENGNVVREWNYDKLVYCDKPKKYPKFPDNEEADQEAEFEGGNSVMYAYLGKSLYYPIYARDNNIQGRVYVQFKVLSNGKVKFECIIGDEELGKRYLDVEAMRVVNLMPDWNPAVLNGENVAIMYNLPIMFKLQ